jgi:hypothetical protein
MGRIANIKVPKGCNEIYVDIEDDKVIVSYGSRINENEFYCDLTGEVETIPGIGDFCVMWNEGERDRAICANFDFRDKRTGDPGRFGANNQKGYDYAIKFRNYEQYLAVKGVINDTIY